MVQLVRNGFSVLEAKMSRMAAEQREMKQDAQNERNQLQRRLRETHEQLQLQTRHLSGVTTRLSAMGQVMYRLVNSDSRALLDDVTRAEIAEQLTISGQPSTISVTSGPLAVADSTTNSAFDAPPCKERRKEASATNVELQRFDLMEFDNATLHKIPAQRRKRPAWIESMPTFQSPNGKVRSQLNNTFLNYFAFP